MLVLKLIYLTIFVSFCSSEQHNVKKVFAVKHLGDDWWENAIFYQIYPRSFKDSNNDGIGDIKGIIEKLDHLQDLGVNATWISSIFKSPQVDQGNDVSDYRDVDPIFGTLDDLKELIDKAHALRIRVILDFVPNHTSDQHQWFKESVAKTEGYEDYYIWHDGKTDSDGNRIPPNNWISAYKGSAWTWNEERQQYYYHKFTPQQPDLNYRNEKVLTELKDIMKFWLDFGVDGLEIDSAPDLFEDAEFKDEPLSNLTGFNENDFEYLDHIYTTHLDETFEMIYEWREFFNEYTATNGGETRIMITEAEGPIETIVRYYSTADESRLGAHFTINFDIIRQLDNSSVGLDVTVVIMNWMETTVDIPFNWMLSNEDVHRFGSRMGKENIDAFNIITGILPGIQIVYNGDEIGQEDGEVTCDEGQDPSAIKNCSIFDEVSRDFERTPYQWNDDINAGFNNGTKPWLPVSSKANETNLAAQKVSGTKSHYSVFKQLSALRAELNTLDDELFAVIMQLENVVQIQRKLNGTYYTLYANTGGKEEYLIMFSDDGIGILVAVSSNSVHNVGDEMNMSDHVLLAPHEAFVVATQEQIH